MNHRMFKFSCLRPFMTDESEEPNIRLRPWLETNIGTQAKDWQWDFYSPDFGILEITFKEKHHAILFELSWP